MSTPSWPLTRVVTTAAVAAIIACDEYVASAPPPGAMVRATKMIGSLEAQLSAPGRVVSDSSITLSVDIANRGNAPATVQAPTGIDAPPIDVLVVGRSGETVWRDPPPGDRIGALRIYDPLAPGDTLHFATGRWDQRNLRGEKVGPGVYRVSVALRLPEPSAATTVGPISVVIDR